MAGLGQEQDLLRRLATAKQQLRWCEDDTSYEKWRDEVLRLTALLKQETTGNK